jgi:hypothetical protein
MKAKTFLVAIGGFVVLTGGAVFSENTLADQTKLAPKSWLRSLYDKLTTPSVKPATIYDSRPQAVPGKTVVIYYGNHPEVVSLNATNRAGLVRLYGQGK